VLINQEKEEEERDSKETRLTLMEEVLLLGLKGGQSFRLKYPSISYSLWLIDTVTLKILNFK
jgi:hypothetical protein